MTLDAEFILLGAGLLEPPTRAHARAVPELKRQLRELLREAVDREDPGTLLLVPDRPSYFGRLFKLKPDYAAINEELGLALGGEYQLLHKRARAIMTERHPVTEVNTIVGPIIVDNSFDQDDQYAHEVETVENHERVPKDLAAGGLLPANVAVFAGIFPEIYAWMCEEVRQANRDRRGKEPDWMPPDWLDGAERILFRVGFEAEVNLAAPTTAQVGTAAPAPKVGGGGKLKVKAAALRTPDQTVLAPSEPNR